MKINILADNRAMSLQEFIESSVDIETLYSVYWEARKKAHTGRLPSALDHESWESFCEDDPESATEFIAPIHTFVEMLLSLKGRGDVQPEISYDLVETGTWLPRKVVRVTARPVYREVKSSARVKKLFSTERERKG